MSNEFKYGIQGLLMAVAFFAAFKIAFFIIGFAEPKQKEKSIFSVDNSVPVISINENGKALFSENCAACHSLHHHNFMGGITERVPDRRLLRAFVRNSQQVIQSGQPYFVKMYEVYNKTAMTAFPDLTNKEIDDIIEYIEQESSNNSY
ncbi:hypothetical protein BH10BAC2_BH10BAC2_49340 [soil metagenome]